MSADEHLDPSSPIVRTPPTILPYVIVRRLKSIQGFNNVVVEIGDTVRDGESVVDLGERVGRETEKRLRLEIRRAVGEGQKTLGDT